MHWILLVFSSLKYTTHLCINLWVTNISKHKPRETINKTILNSISFWYNKLKIIYNFNYLIYFFLLAYKYICTRTVKHIHTHIINNASFSAETTERFNLRTQIKLHNCWEEKKEFRCILLLWQQQLLVTNNRGTTIILFNWNYLLFLLYLFIFVWLQLNIHFVAH